MNAGRVGRRARVGLGASGLALLVVLVQRGVDLRAQELPPEDAGEDAVASDERGRPPVDLYDEGAFAYLFTGIMGLSVQSINDALAPYDYGSIDSLFFTVGTGAFITVDRFLFGLERYTTLANDSEGGTHSSALDGSYWLAHAAYLVSLGPVHLYPIFGVGVSTWTLGLAEGQPDFEAAVERRPSTRELELTAFMIQWAFAAEYLFPTSRAPDSVRGFLVGLRLGYYLSPFEAEWTLLGNDVTDVPEFQIRAPYLSLVVGFGSWRASEYDSWLPFGD